MTAEPTTKPRRLPCFSLRSLILLVALAGSGYGLWYRWEPWVLETTFPQAGADGGFALSPDGTRLVATTGDRQVVIWDIATGQETVSDTSTLEDYSVLARLREE